MRGGQEKSEGEKKRGTPPKAFHSTLECSAQDTLVTVHSIPIITCNSLCGTLLPLPYDL